MKAWNVLPIACALFVAACGEASSNEHQESLDVLAEVVTDGDLVIRFKKIGDEGILISEVGPGDVPSVVTHYVMEEQATALEMFLALAPDQDVPQELIADHGRISGDAPRALAAPTPRFAAVSATEYATNCAYSSDGPWFDNLWASNGWTWHWYQNVTAPFPIAGYNSPNKTASNFISHLCNYSVSHEGVGHYVYNTQYVDGSYPVEVGHRSVVTVSSVSGTWRAQAAGPNYGTGTVRLGAMAP